ncbi:MAG: ATP-binding protein, partial [Verrucomicrobiota bacterium]
AKLDDWVYVYNFIDPYKPNALKLPQGMGKQLKTAMAQFVEDVDAAMPVAFEGDDFKLHRTALEKEFSDKEGAAFAVLQKAAKKESLALLKTPNGIALAPMADGEVMEPTAFQQLPEKERKVFEEAIKELQEDLEALLEQVPKWKQEFQRRLKELCRGVSRKVVELLVADLRSSFQEVPAVLEYLDAVVDDMVKNALDFLAPEESEEEVPAGFPGETWDPGARRYDINLLVDHSGTAGIPIVFEDNGSHSNLVGRVEHATAMGSLMTDFTLIKPGALHRANGGYLILDARQLLMEPYAWEGLKRTLNSQLIRIESLSQLASTVHTVSLEPEPIPLDIKVILVGDRHLYYRLSNLDRDFAKLFKVMADFEDDMPRSPQSARQYARLLGTLIDRENLLHLDRSAVGRVVEHSSRMAATGNKLSLHTESLLELLQEADFFARRAQAEVVSAEHVEKALDEQEYRSGRLPERVWERIHDNTVLIQTSGDAVGQINGLSVLHAGTGAFGQPNRITVRTRKGSGRVTDIEREVKLGGPLHSKGVLILSGFLAATFLPDERLSVSASIVFEQSYGGVDGDSASSAELYALLSSLSGVPIKQSLAVTGSVNQFGEVQAIGGANEKIEGFFEVCRHRGLTGQQGVLIPQSNAK